MCANTEGVKLRVAGVLRFHLGGRERPGPQACGLLDSHAGACDGSAGRGLLAKQLGKHGVRVRVRRPSLFQPSKHGMPLKPPVSASRHRSPKAYFCIAVAP